MNKYLRNTALLFFSCSLTLSAYDTQTAQVLEKSFSVMTQERLAKGASKVSADRVMEMLRNGDDFTLLDIRTPGEKSVIAIAVKNTVAIPVNLLFKKKNLDKLPANKPLIVVCHSGSRAQQAAAGLRAIGFKNVKVLKGGLKALANSDSTKNAPIIKNHQQESRK
jgi:rhodanese-related sulfurtransferase